MNSSSTNILNRFARASRYRRNAAAPRVMPGASLAAAAALAAALLAAQAAPARASVFNYGGAGSSYTVNAGILQLDSAQQVSSGLFNTPITATSGALYSFYILDQCTDYKPAGWRFLNPLAPTTVTTDLLNEFPGSYNIGQEVTANMPVYWMVNLPSVAAGYVPGATNPLAQYNVLVIRVGSGATKYLGLSRAEREMLRDYVDQGGTLWIEDAGGANALVPDEDDGNKDTPAGLFVDVAFNDNSALNGQPYLSDASHRHPILTAPNFLTYQDLAGLSYGYPNSTTGLPSLPYYLSSLLSANDAPDSAFLTTVMGNSYNQLPSIAAGDFGSGHVVIDDCDILGGISETVQPTANDTYGTPGVRAASAGYAPTSLAAAQPSDLQFAYNLIAWSGSESATDGADARHSGAQTGADIGSSLLGNWAYPDTSVNGASAKVNGYGVAISGNVAYVTSSDSKTGGVYPTLHAFDINPSEDLDQNGNPDDGDSTAGYNIDPTTLIPYTADFSAGLNYDELWAYQFGADTNPLSAPTIASLPVNAFSDLTNGGNINPTGYYDSVLFADIEGDVYIEDATSNPGANDAPAEIPTGSGAKYQINALTEPVVPSPVYSHGWLIAPQPTDVKGSGYPTVFLAYLGDRGTHHYYKERLDGSASAETGDTTDVIATPAIAMVPSLDTTYGGSDIVAYVATQKAVYPQFLGSRDEEVNNNSGLGFQTKVEAIEGVATSTSAPFQGVVGLFPAPEDADVLDNDQYFTYLSASPDWNTGATGLQHVPNFRPATISGTPAWTIQPGLQGANETGLTNAYADYDVKPGTGAAATLSRHQIIAEPGGTISTSDGTAIAGIAVGDDDTLYLTVNEAKGAYVEAVQEQNPMLNTTDKNGTLIKWRYTIGPASTLAPSNLQSTGLRFIGAPVVDSDHVYALATNGADAYVLCLNHDASFTFTAGAITEGGVTVQQTDENGNLQTVQPGQYSITDDQLGTISITDFSPSPTSNYQIYPNLSASIPVQSSSGEAGAQSASTSISSNSDGSALLQWSTEIALNGTTPGGLREFGSFLYFGNGAVAVANSTTGAAEAEIVSLDSATGALQSPSLVSAGTAITEPMAASGNDVIGVGPTGIVGAAFAGTLVADNSRLIEYAPDGSPMWSLDSTTEQAPVVDTSSATPTMATTNISLSRPSSVTLINSNDILFADTGNNRCVQTDRSGNVLWELNSFNDPTGLLAPGQPLTLNDPTSVIEWRETPSATGSTNVLTIEHYLIADAGNSRIVEIDDIYTNGNIYKTDPTEYHVLRWVSHTFDQAGRTYRYVYANRYFTNDPAGDVYILAGVANRQIAPLVVTSSTPVLDTAAKDSPGSSIVLLNYAPYGNSALTLNPSYTPPGGSTSSPAYQAPAYSPTTTPVAGNGLPLGLINQIIYGTSNQPVTIPIRNLRYVDAYLPFGQQDGNGKPAENIVIADDDGVFDGIALGNANAHTFSIVAIAPYTPPSGTSLNNRIGFSFMQSDYNLLSSVTGTSTTPKYAPASVFTPTSAQRLDNGDYLITNGATTGDATAVVESYNAQDIDVTNNLRHFGGDVIEVSGTNKTQVGHTFGREKTSVNERTTSTAAPNVNTTAPLSLPAYATREQ